MEHDSQLLALNLDPGDTDFFDALQGQEYVNQISSSALSMNSTIANLPSTRQIETEMNMIRKRNTPDNDYLSDDSSLSFD